MDNLGDWLYIIVLAIAGISSLLSSKKKKTVKKQAPEIDVPEFESVENPEPGKNVWDILKEMQKEQIQSVEPKESPIAKPQSIKKTRSPFLPGEQHSATTISRHSPVLAEEEEAFRIAEETFNDPAELRKAIIYTEILNRKY